jgi:hypothetical protein
VKIVEKNIMVLMVLEDFAQTIAEEFIVGNE